MHYVHEASAAQKYMIHVGNGKTDLKQTLGGGGITRKGMEVGAHSGRGVDNFLPDAP